MDLPSPTRRLNLFVINKNKGTYQLVDFTVQADFTIKIKENEKRNW